MKIFNRKKKLNLNEDAKANKILNNSKVLKENFEEEHPDFYDAIWDATEVIGNIQDELNDDYDFTADNLEYLGNKIIENGEVFIDVAKKLRGELSECNELNESIKTLEPIMTDREISAVTSVPLAIASAYEDSKRADEHMEADMKEKEKVVREFLKDSEVIKRDDEYSIKLELNESLFSEANQELSKIENTASNLFTRDAAIINKINSVEGVVNYLKSIRDECKTPKYIDKLIAKAAASRNLFKALELLYNVNLKGDNMGVNLKEGRAKKGLFDNLFDEIYTQLASSPMGSAYTQYRGEYDDENELGISYDDENPNRVGIHITSNDISRFDSAKKLADAYNLESTIENIPGLENSYKFIIWMDEDAPAWNSPVRFKGEFIKREETDEH